MKQFLYRPKGKVARILRELKQLDAGSRDTLIAYRENKLQLLIDHAWRQCPGYRRRWTEVGISSGSAPSAQSLANLPVTTRDDLEQATELGLLAGNIDTMMVETAVTSGTTREALRVQFDSPRRFNMGNAIDRKIHGWWGCERSDRMATLMGIRSRHGKNSLRNRIRHIKKNLAGRRDYDTMATSPELLQRYYESLYRFKPAILHGWAVSLERLAAHINEHSLPLWNGLKVASNRAMKLYPHWREEIEAVFRIPMLDTYATTEVGQIAAECVEQRCWHIHEEHVILETVDEKGQPVVGEEGSVLITDLDNYATPLIRYEIGDRAIITQEPCACGRPQLIMQELVGRAPSEVKLGNGRILRAGNYLVMFADYPELRDACVRIVTPLHIQIDLLPGQPIPVKVHRDLQNRFRDWVGDEIQIEIREVTHIPNVKSGKAPTVRYAEDELRA